jgi:hypothetical protein
MTERPRGLKLEIGETADFSHVWIRREGGKVWKQIEREFRVLKKTMAGNI